MVLQLNCKGGKDFTMTPNIEPSIITGIVATCSIVLNNLWVNYREKSKYFTRLKNASDRTQMDFANTIRNELREEIVVNREDIKLLSDKCSEWEKSYETLKSDHIQLIEQHGELKIQYATAIQDRKELCFKYEQALADSRSCTQAYKALQTKYEEVLSKVGVLQGMITPTI